VALTISCSLPLQTPYFLITDADTFFIRELEALTLLDQQDCTPDSSICDLQRKVGCICVTSILDRRCTPASHISMCGHVSLSRTRCAPMLHTQSPVCVAGVQVQFRARNELQAPVQWADQKEWIKLSAQVLNVSALAEPVQNLRGRTCVSQQYHH
jgi:hypothetical protein